MKQADVVLLGFPLMHPMSAEVRRNDLEMYEPVTDPAGPAMTWVRRGQGPAWDWPPGGCPHPGNAAGLGRALGTLALDRRGGGGGAAPLRCHLSLSGRACLPWAGWS